MEAKHLVCAIEVEDIASVQRFFEAFGGEQRPSLSGSVRLQVGMGLVELTHREHGYPFYPPFSVKLVVGDPEWWRVSLASKGVEVPNRLSTSLGGQRGFTKATPAGPDVVIAEPLAGVDDVSLQAPTGEGPQVLHFQTTWWSKQWQADYAFLTNEGLGLVTSRGRGEPEGSRICFLRAAYGGKAIVEVVDGLFDDFAGPGLHWLISIVVDDAAAFQRRMAEAGQPVTDVRPSPWGVPSFTGKSEHGPLLFVYQEREGGTPGMVGAPAGLSSM